MGYATGVANLEKYMLNRVGIEAERVSSGSHSFIRLKDIEIPTDEGMKRGDTLLDPTWNMANHRFGARPEHFCLSYEEIRKADITDEGIDRKCHENEELAEVELKIDDSHLREIYTSIRIS